MIKKKTKKPTRTKLIKEADTLVSLYVRQKNATSEGTVFCYTCNTPKHWKQIHCGHYVSRTFKYTRWELDNLRPQCYACNVLKKGMAHIFRQNLVEEIGEERVRSIETQAQVLFKEKDEYIEKKIEEIRELSTLKEMLDTK